MDLLFILGPCVICYTLYVVCYVVIVSIGIVYLEYESCVCAKYTVNIDVDAFML